MASGPAHMALPALSDGISPPWPCCGGCGALPARSEGIPARLYPVSTVREPPRPLQPSTSNAATASSRARRKGPGEVPAEAAALR